MSLDDSWSDFPEEEWRRIYKEMVYKGNTGLVMPLPGGDRVVKVTIPWHAEYDLNFSRNQLRREIAVYRHLPQGHRRLIRMLACNEAGGGKEGTADDVSITFECLPYSLRSYLQGGAKFPCPDEEELARAAAIPRRRRACWALEATDGVVLLHAHDVVHADLRPENMLLDDQLHVRLIDFSGCALGDQPALSNESAAFYMPRTPALDRGPMGCSVTTDLFALGSSIYNIVTGEPPHGSETPHDVVEERIARGEFPPLVEGGGEGGAGEDNNSKGAAQADDDGADTRQASGAAKPLLFADTIWRCWHAKFDSAADVLAALKADIRAAFGPEDQAFIEQETGLSLAEA